MSSGGKGDTEVVVGYRYLMGVQLAVCYGPVDRLNRIIVGERLAWDSGITVSGQISINKPQLFGGDDREGGVKGTVDVMMGETTQGRNSYLAAQQGANCPAYRGILSLVFRKFLWSSGNPYFKAPWLDVTRILQGWFNGSAWNPDYAIINALDMNPAHIIYQCLTDPAWGMGYSTADIGDSFYSVAAALSNEGFGLSLKWDAQSSIEDFVKSILTHINGTLALDVRTGKFELRLIRADYNPATLFELNETNVLELKSFQRAAFGDAANEVVVTYTDRDENEKTVTVQDLASVTAQGGVISTSRSYPGIRDDDLAARVAMRDLATLSSPLAQATVVTNRSMWDKEIGDVVRFTWPSLGVNGVVFRIISVNKGNLGNGEIEVTMVEDVFGLPESNYVTAPPSQWVETVVPPIQVDSGRAVEAPYWEIARRLPQADQAYLQPDYGFGTFMAGRGAVQSMLGYVLSASADNTTYADVANGSFSPTGLLVSNITAIQETITLTAGFDLDSAVLETNGGYAYIGSECVAVVSVDPSTGQVGVRRGILDTVPKSHVAGTRVFFVTPAAAYDQTERTAGEAVYYKPRPNTGLGTLDLEDAEEELLVFTNRASRPYPPGNFKVAGEYYPAYITGPNVDVSWSHRDRAAQTVDFADYKTGNIGPEAGVSYRLRVYSGATLLHTYDLDGATTSWSYPTEHDIADGNMSVLRITLHSVRDGLESWQGIDHSFQRSVVSGGYSIDTPPAQPVLTAAPDYFANYLSWVFGDARTNLDYTEIRVAEVPDINKSTVLQVVNYPDQDFMHELGTVRGFRWYWVRVADANGQLSPWSNMASSRANATDPVTMLNDINGLLSDNSGTAKIEMVADRFSIVAPDGSKTPFAVVESSPGVWKTLLNSDVLIGGNVDIANLSTGALPNDVVMRLGGGVIELDGAGEIRVFKDLSPNADFVRLSSGEIRFLRYIGGTYQTYNYLSRLETGQANSGTTVTIPGYWKAQPRIMVSPANLMLYNKDYAAQNQSINCQALNIQETFAGSGVYQFDATATLTLSANSGGSAINAGSGDISTNTYTSGTQVSPANCTQITPSVQVRSQRGNGVGQFYRRSIKWRVEYYNGSSWVNGSWRTVNMGDQFAAVTDSQAFNFPSAGTWQWRIGYEVVDTDGTTFGATSYTYSEETVYASNSGATQDTTFGSPNYQSWYFNFRGSQATNVRNQTIAFGTPSGSGEIYRIDYICDYEWGLTGAYGTDWVEGWSRLYKGASLLYQSGGPLSPSRFDNDAGATYPSKLIENRTLTVNGSNLTFESLTAQVEWDNAGGFYGPSTVDIYKRVWVCSPSEFDRTRAIIYRRTPVPNSTTPVNNFLLTSYNYILTSAQVLASGTLNWTAIGE